MKIFLDLGIVGQDILVTALKEYELDCRCNGNYVRAEEIKDMLDKLPI